MEERQGQILGKVMTFLLLVSMLLVVKESAAYVNVLTQKEIVQTQKTIVIDPGHGGNDPGKVGINQALEKDVNLEIALKLKKYLEQQDIHVVMTRQEVEACPGGQCTPEQLSRGKHQWSAGILL